jgi:ABC-type glutathione transport system ATPase component
MKIERFSYHDKATGWKLEPVEFGNLNLLVGLSGSGKTRILRALSNLKNIASGGSLSGVEWEVLFKANNDEIIGWSGAFEVNNDNNPNPKLTCEKILVNGQEIVKRTSEEFYFENELYSLKLGMR